MPSHKTLVFHIGDHKTGSTSIQLACAENRVQLEQKTLLYPARLAMNWLKPRFRAWLDQSNPAAQAQAGQALGALAQQIDRADVDYVLISAEAFETLSPARFKQVVDHFFADVVDEIRVIAYVRPHAARLLSSFSERTKLGQPKLMQQSLTEFAAHCAQSQELHYFPRFQAWRALYGPNFVLRPMIRSQLHKESVEDDFITHAFPQTPYRLIPGQRANESLDLLDLMRLKVLQRCLQHQPQLLRHRVGWEFSRQAIARQATKRPQKLQLHKALAKQIRSTYLDDARAMDQAFFANQPLMEQALQQEVRRARYRAHSTAPEAHLSASERHSIELMASFITTMLDQDTVNWPQFFHQKRLDTVDRSRALQQHKESSDTAAKP